MDSYEYVILGGGMVAGYAAKEFDKQGVDGGDLCIISADNTVPYQRPPLSKDFLTGEEDIDDILISSPEFYEERDIAVHLGTWIKSVDLQQKQLESVAGKKFGYEKLLIATGAWPRKLNIPGGNLHDVYYLRNIPMSKAIREAAALTTNAIVVGAGFIGMEVASVLAQYDVNVTMVYIEDQIMAGRFPPQIADYFESYYRDKGVRLVSNATVQSILGDKTAEGVKLESGDTISAGVIVIGIGVYPETSCLADTSLDISDGVLANEYLETEVDDVYVAGDVARYHDRLFDKVRRFEHEDNARHQGRHVARVMLGRREPFVHVPYFYSDMFDLSWEYWGDSAPAERILYRGEVESGSFYAWWVAQDRVMAAFALNKPWKQGKFIDALIKEQKTVDPGRLTDEDVPLEELGQ